MPGQSLTVCSVFSLESQFSKSVEMVTLLGLLEKAGSRAEDPDPGTVAHVCSGFTVSRAYLQAKAPVGLR